MDPKESIEQEIEDVGGLQPQMGVDRFTVAGRISGYLHRYTILLKKYWWAMLLGIILGVGPAFVLISITPPKYQSEGRMVMAQRVNVGDKLVTDDIQNFMGTQSEMLKSSTVHSNAMELFLQQHPEAMEEWTNMIALNPNARMFDFTSRHSLRNQMITLTVTGKDEKQVQDYLNDVMQAYLNYKKELKSKTSENTFEVLTKQMAILDSEIMGLRDGISDFRATNNVVMLEQVGSGRAKELGEINTELNRCKRELATLDEMTPEQIQAVVMRDGGAGNVGGIINQNAAVNRDVSSGMASALSKPQTEYYKSLQELEILKANRETLSEFLRDSHPKIRDIDEKIDALQSVVDSFKQMALDIVKSQRDALEIRVKKLQESFDDMQMQASAADKMLVEFTNMQDDLKHKQDTYQKMTEMLRTVDLSKVNTSESLSVMDAAGPAKNITHRMLKLLLGFLFGIGAGCVVLYLIDLFDDTFGTIAELQSQILEPVLGQIPEVKEFAESDKIHLLSEENKDSYAMMESFRNLRSSIVFSSPKGKMPKVICFTSSVPMEGKSTVSANLAVSLIMAGKRVLLIDGDIRRGTLYKKFKTPQYPGLVEVLHQTTAGEKFLHTVELEVPNSKEKKYIDFIASGRLQKSPGELFLSPAWGVLLSENRPKYDFIIIDSAPMLATDDTSNLAQLVDAVIFVVRGGFTSFRYTRESLRRLRSRRINMMGLVFNRGYASRGDSYYYYYDYYEYHGVGPDGKKIKKRRKRKGKGDPYHSHSHEEEVSAESSTTSGSDDSSDRQA